MRSQLKPYDSRAATTMSKKSHNRERQKSTSVKQVCIRKVIYKVKFQTMSSECGRGYRTDARTTEDSSSSILTIAVFGQTGRG
jgi:hypothetical protein